MRYTFRPMSNQSIKIARLVGHTLAHVQDGVDFVVDTGFKLLKKAGDTKPVVDPDESKYTYKAKVIGRNVAKFVGVLGESYFSQYNKLKTKKQG